jgi:uncharacterized protein
MSTENEDDNLQLLLVLTREFYDNHRHLIKESHGYAHAMQVYDHACRAVDGVCQTTPALKNATTRLEICAAALLHDVDDSKYFSHPSSSSSSSSSSKLEHKYVNAVHILQQANFSNPSIDSVLFMIDQVSCSQNGNAVPSSIQQDKSLCYWLIPRWADRIEAVGARGVWRCYQYNLEKGAPLSTPDSPRPKSLQELWSYATPQRFQAYQERGGSSSDMISHYYDKLLHVACPPKDIVRNPYLEERLQDSAKELIEVCLRFGQTGVVDEEYIQSLKC